jgi:N-dimethylarginine dimethylaminohydrolase
MLSTAPNSFSLPIRKDCFSAGKLDQPGFLLCPPFSHSIDQPNNAWMVEPSSQEDFLDRNKGLKQFLDLYHYLASNALVYLLPTPAASGLQDQVFTANLAFVPEHLTGRNTAIIANFTSAPRKEEAKYGAQFFRAMGYETVIPEFLFEGEAEIKHLYDNIYIGGYGERTDRRVYDWMEKTFDMKIVKVEERDPHLYHLDCSIFPLTGEETIVCTEILRKEEVKEIEKYTGIIDVSKEIAYCGICNSVRLHNSILNASDIHDLKAGTEEYRKEIAKNRALEDIAAERAFEPVFFNLSEYMKSGALLSCMVMHLNRHSNSVELV